MATNIRKKNFQKFHQQNSSVVDTFYDQECAFIHLMHDIMHPSSYSMPEGSRRYITAESQRVTMRVVQNECEVNSYNEWYPCIFVMVNKTQDNNRCIVAWRDLRYHLTLSEALLVAMQLYLVFKLEYPPPCVNFWHFVRDYFFDIQLPQDISYPMLAKLKPLMQLFSPILCRSLQS
nr:uncharacterized protein LOC106625040 [Bactrocera oleae]XP_036229903.1 uncharacterized protein LOC106625040 [Bactrocera oleae]